MAEWQSQSEPQEVQIPADQTSLGAVLAVPPGARRTVVFVHGTGSSRHSKRNEYVAAGLRRDGLATVLFDLVAEGEADADRKASDMGLLAGRLWAVIEWLRQRPEAADLPVGCVGGSTGAAVALIAAARHPESIAAVVSRGGRLDLARDALDSVNAATLLIVGERDEIVLRLNEELLPLLGGKKQLAIVPGASHLFEEPGALDEVTRLSRKWFGQHLAASQS